MSGVVKINITETAEQLKRLLKQQKTASVKERIQALYLLKSQQVETVGDVLERLLGHETGKPKS